MAIRSSFDTNQGAIMLRQRQRYRRYVLVSYHADQKERLRHNHPQKPTWLTWILSACRASGSLAIVSQSKTSVVLVGDLVYSSTEWGHKHEKGAPMWRQNGHTLRLVQPVKFLQARIEYNYLLY